MIARVTRAKKGLANYLEFGKRKDSNYTRTEKDNVIPIYGNLHFFRQTERFLNKEKNYKDNYLHITISYSKEDMQLMERMKNDEKMAMKKDIVETYIKHHTSGYSLHDEVISYAETHKPIIKFEKGKERLEHEHIAIALYNPTSDTKLQTTFHNNSFIDDTLQAYINKKYNLSAPIEHTRGGGERRGIEVDTQVSSDRKYYIELFKNIKTKNELKKYLKENNIEHKEVKNSYFKIKNKNSDYINLKGKGFEHVVNFQKDFVFNEDKNIENLKEVLNSYYKKRVEQIDKRRSTKSKEAIKNIYKEQTKCEHILLESLQPESYQQKIFYKQYKHQLFDNLKGYFIDTKIKNKTKFTNKKKNINIEDVGDKIISNQANAENLQEQVTLMLHISAAKKWDINTLVIDGNKEFKEEVERQIANKIKIEELENKNLPSIAAALAVKQEIGTRPISVTQQLKKEAEQKQEQKEADDNISLSMLKQDLKAKQVLNYAVDKYKLNISDFEVTEENKINNINNKQKPKNVIDFLQKEVNIGTREAIEICKSLYFPTIPKPEVVTPDDRGFWQDEYPTIIEDDYPTIPKPEVVTPDDRGFWQDEYPTIIEDDYPTIPEPKVVTPKEKEAKPAQNQNKVDIDDFVIAMEEVKRNFIEEYMSHHNYSRNELKEARINLSEQKIFNQILKNEIENSSSQILIAIGEHYQKLQEQLEQGQLLEQVQEQVQDVQEQHEKEESRSFGMSR